MGVTLLFFVGYLVLTIAVGLWAASRGKNTEEDYFLAGRRLSALSMSLSAVSSGRSAWLVVGASAAAWSTGLSAVWLFPGYILAEAILFVSVGPRLRQRSVELEAITVPEVIEKLGRGSRSDRRLPLRSISGAISCLFLVTYVSAQLGAGAKTLGGVFEIDGSTWGLFIVALVVLVYTLVGGYRAVVVTDVLQAVFMLMGMVLLPLLGLHSIGGLGALMFRLEEIDPGLTLLAGGGLASLGGLAIGLGSFGNPHILVRHMSLEDPGQARVAMITGTFWNVVMAGGALLMGLVGRALYPTTAELAGEGREYLFATLTQDMTARYLLPGFAGFFLATLFAAVMSTCDSQLLVIASSVVRDFRRSASGHRSGILLSRLAVFVTLAVAVALSYGDIPLVNNLVLLSWAALGAAFGPALLLGLFDSRVNERGLLAGIVVGGLSVVLLWWFLARPAGRAITWELIPSYLLSASATWALRDPLPPAS